MVLFTQNSGFTGIECGQNGFFTDSEGMVWIPTSDLVTRFDPQKLIEKKIDPPKIFIKTECFNLGFFTTPNKIINDQSDAYFE